jgi:uroporphyrinogen-III synthase
MASVSFNGLRVLSLESRRSREMASLITNYGGQAIEAPSMREVPVETNTEALAFADALARGEVDLVILLTGVGTRALLRVVEQVRGSVAAFVEALKVTRIAARGPKPVAVLRELGITPWLVAPEPNTWRELVAALDAKRAEFPLTGKRVAVQEYGAPNPSLTEGLSERGARVSTVPIYQWALPEDLGPLRSAIEALGRNDIDVVLFTTATQVTHLLQVATEMGLADDVRQALARLVVASIGPTTSEELREKGIRVDLEPSHPKMGFLVREAAERAEALRVALRATSSTE